MSYCQDCAAKDAEIERLRDALAFRVEHGWLERPTCQLCAAKDAEIKRLRESMATAAWWLRSPEERR